MTRTYDNLFARVVCYSVNLGLLLLAEKMAGFIPYSL